MLKGIFYKNLFMFVKKYFVTNKSLTFTSSTQKIKAEIKKISNVFFQNLDFTKNNSLYAQNFLLIVYSQ